MRNLKSAALLLAPALLAACDAPDRDAQGNTPQIQVRSAEQNQLHQLSALNLAIALKRANYDAGYTCQRETDAGFVGAYENLDMWMARCTERDWAIFAGPDGSAQVRDCKDVAATGLPACTISRKPEGSFDGQEGPSG